MKEFLIAWDRDELVVTEDADVTIGRNPGSDIYFADKRLSREHALISLKDEVMTLEDLGSSNGTLLNNKLIKGKEVLKDRDRVVAGPLHITIRISEKAEAHAGKEGASEFKCPKCDFAVSAEAKFCPGCGESLENLVSVPTCRKCKTELVPGALFCPSCGDSIKEIVLAKTPKGDGSGLHPSEVGPRVVAGIIDSLIVAILFVTLVLAPALFGYIITSDLESGEGFSLSNQAVTLPGGGGLILFVVIYSVLYGYLWGSRGKSPGMAVSGIQITDLNGSSLGFGKGALRALVALIVPGWILIFMNSRKQTLHDIIAGSMVTT